MKAILTSVIKKITIFLVPLVLLVAVAIGASYFLSPIVAEHKADIEHWASDLLKTPVTINQVELSWYHYQPVINLNEVTILNKDTKEPALQIQKVRLFFSIPKSIWYWKPISSGILISGSEVVVHSGKNDQFTVQGFPAFGGKEEPYKSETSVNDILLWLAEQPSLILQNIDVHYTSFTRQQRFVTLQKLSIINSSSKHIILGDGILHQQLPTSLNLAIDWSGNPTDLTTIKADIYAYISGLSLSQWLKDSEYQGWRIKEGIGTAKVWTAWDNNSLQRIQTMFQIYGVQLYSATDKSAHAINRLSGNVGWKRDGNQQIIAGDEILIDFPTHYWPMTNFEIHLMQDLQDEGHSLQPIKGRLSYVNIEDVKSFLFSSPHFLPDIIYKTLSSNKLIGSLQNLDVVFPQPNWQDWQHLTFAFDAIDLSVIPWSQFPGINNLSAKLHWSGNKGTVELKNINPVTLEYNAIFAKPIVLNQFAGLVDVQTDENKIWTVTTKQIQLLNNDLAANIQGQLVIGKEATPTIDLVSHFSLQKASHITRYLPLQIFDKSLVEWLKQAFTNGEVKSGEAVLKGKLTDFPFDQNNGTFQISGNVSNVELNYAPDWPSIKKVNGKLVFVGRHMSADVDQAEIHDIPVTNIHAEINSIGGNKPANLQVTGKNIKTELKEGMRFIQQSPLNATIGKMFTDINPSGLATLNLDLTIPLDDPDKTQVQGLLQFKDAVIDMPAWELQINHLKGPLHFTESATDASGIQGQIFNKPITLGIKTENKTFIANFATNLAANDLGNWLKIPVAKVMNGASDVTGEIKVAMGAPLLIHLQSDLVGMALTLPREYSKTQQESKNLIADIILQEKEPIKIKVNYGKDLGAALILSKHNQNFKLQSANIQLGQGEVAWPPGPGLYISAVFDTLDFATIKTYSEQSLTQNKDYDIGLPLRGVNVHANKLLLGGQQLNQVNLQIAKNNELWNINIDSDHVKGSLQLPTEFNGQGSIKGKFDRLKISSSGDTNKKELDVDIKSLPAIDIDANNVSYNDIDLGNISFNATHIPLGGGMIINTLNISSPRMNLTATGDWSIDNDTQLKGSVTSDNVSALLNSFGLDAHNYIVSNGKIGFDISWNGAPYAPTLSSFNGNARLDVGHGRIIDVGQSNNAKMDLGRMLNIFSLQNLPRRLTLDFSDLYEKGYSFDYIRGDFSFRNGDAFTQNLEINGPVIRVMIDGRIGLTAKIYDLTVSITPHDVTSSIPVAATILVNPVVGLAALGVNTVISPSLSQAATYYYNVSGPWSNPKWRSVSR